MRSLQIALISLVFATATCFAQRGGGGHGGGGGRTLWVEAEAMLLAVADTAAVPLVVRTAAARSAVVAYRGGVGRRLSWRLWRLRISRRLRIWPRLRIWRLGTRTWISVSAIPTTAAITAIRTLMDIPYYGGGIIQTPTTRSLRVWPGSLQLLRLNSTPAAAVSVRTAAAATAAVWSAIWPAQSTARLSATTANGYPPPPPQNGATTEFGSSAQQRSRTAAAGQQYYQSERPVASLWRFQFSVAQIRF